MRIDIETLQNTLNQYANDEQNYRSKIARYIIAVLHSENGAINLPKALLLLEAKTKIRVHEALKYNIATHYIRSILQHIPDETKYSRLHNSLDNIVKSTAQTNASPHTQRSEYADKQLLVQNYYSTKPPEPSEAKQKKTITSQTQLPTKNKRKRTTDSSSILTTIKRKTQQETKDFLLRCSKEPALWEAQSGDDKSNLRKQWKTHFGDLPEHMQSVKKERSTAEMRAYVKRCADDKKFWKTQTGNQKAQARTLWGRYKPSPKAKLPTHMQLTVTIPTKDEITSELEIMRDNPSKWNKLSAKRKANLRASWDIHYDPSTLPSHMKPQTKRKASEVRSKLLQYAKDAAAWKALSRFEKSNLRAAWEDTHFKGKSLPEHMQARTSKRPEQLQEYAQSPDKWYALKPPMRTKLRNDWDKYFPNTDLPPHMEARSGSKRKASSPFTKKLVRKKTTQDHVQKRSKPKATNVVAL